MPVERHRIQRLGPNDTEILAELCALFGQVFEMPETYTGNPPPVAYRHRLLANPFFTALVAWSDDRVVGGLTAYELPKPEKAHSEIYLYDLAVAADHRRRGVATALIRQLQALAEERGAWVVFVQADHGDDPAIALYDKLGIREAVLHFDLPIPPPRR